MSDLGLIVLLLPLLLLAVIVLVLFGVRSIARLVVNRERGRMMWIDTVFIWMMAMLLKIPQYRKPLQP